jgi:hypothetical protein
MWPTAAPLAGMTDRIKALLAASGLLVRSLCRGRP